MNKSILSIASLIIIVLSAQLSFAQTTADYVEVHWGPEQKNDSKKETLSDVLGFDGTGIYAVKAKYAGGLARAEFISQFGGKAKAKFSIQHYDKEMKLTKSVEIDLRKAKQPRVLEYIAYINDEIRVFSSFINKKKKQNYFFVETVNKKTLKLNNDLKKLASVDFSNASKYNAGNFQYRISRDTTKILVFYNLPYEKKGNEKFGFHVYDKDYNQLWEKEIELPYQEELFDVNNYIVSNQGNVYVLGRLFKDKRDTGSRITLGGRSRGKSNYTYKALAYTADSKKANEYTLELGKFFLTDMALAITDEGDLICGGFYSEVGNFSIKGSYFLKVDGTTKKVKNETSKEFGIDFITQNLTERQQKRQKKKDAKGKDVELYEYDLNKIVLRDDGGVVLVGEQYYIKSHTRTSTSSNGVTSTSTYYSYHYNDIIVINMQPSGNIDWTIKIPKRQTTISDGGLYSSYAIAIVGDKMHFVFNDNAQNLSYKGDGKLYNYSQRDDESIVTLVTLDRAGEQKRSALFMTKDADVITRPKVCEQISDTELVIFGQKKKGYRFAVVDFEE